MIELIEVLKAVLFGIVEGVTEWLPISSTGHLTLLNEVVKLKVSDEFYSMFEVVIQLGAILADILAPEQYDTEVAVVPDSRNHVEFAVKLPGKNDDTVYLPIDSKFPGDTYTALCNAYDSGDKVMIEEASKALVVAIKKCAKDIHDKYICPPYTTNFAVMFLPFEGLYAEVVKLGLVEELQRNYGVSIAGPTTMSALLNSLYMGFRTLAVQKRSSEVWKILSSVKKEFETFEDALTKTKKHLQQVDSDLETLVGVRTRAINKQLMNVGEDSITDSTAARISTGK